jgi:hypothetical protein
MATVESNYDYDPEPLPLPRRRRLPVLTAILGVAVVGAATFVAGAEAQKHWGAASSSGNGGANASSFASRFGRTGTTAGSATAGGFAGGGGATIGTVTAIKGSTLYVTDTSGNTVKVTAPTGTTVSKTVTTSLKGVNPGDTVVVRGTAAANGNVTAQQITIGGAGGGFGGFGGRSSSGGGGFGNAPATGFGGGNG